MFVSFILLGVSGPLHPNHASYPLMTFFACPFMSLITIHDPHFPTDDTTFWVLVKISSYLKLIPLGLIINYRLSWFLREKPYEIIVTCVINEYLLMPHILFSFICRYLSIFCFFDNFLFHIISISCLFKGHFMALMYLSHFWSCFYLNYFIKITS